MGYWYSSLYVISVVHPRLDQSLALRCCLTVEVSHNQLEQTKICGNVISQSSCSLCLLCLIVSGKLFMLLYCSVHQCTIIIHCHPACPQISCTASKVKENVVQLTKPQFYSPCLLERFQFTQRLDRQFRCSKFQYEGVNIKHSHTPSPFVWRCLIVITTNSSIPIVLST